MTQLSVAPSADGGTTFVVTAQVAIDTVDVALLWPMPGIVPSSVVPIPAEHFARIEPFTRGRVERYTCDELMTTVHWATPPGCASYEVAPLPEPSGEAAIDDVGADAVYADVDVEAVVVAPELLAEWLLVRGLAASPEMDAVLQAHVLAGDSFLAVHPLAPVPAGTFLPPVQFAVPSAAPHTLPLGLGAVAATTEHLLVLYGVAPADSGAVAIDNYAIGVVEDDCMLPEGISATAWYETGVEASRTQILPTWILVHGDRPDSCQPCVTDPLETFELADYGASGEPADTLVSRAELRYDGPELDEDPVVSFDGLERDASLRWIERDVDLGFAFATCGEEDQTAEAGECEDIHISKVEDPGCATAPAAVPIAGVLGLLLLVRRRRWVGAVVAALLVAAVGDASAASVKRPKDRGPRWEIKGGGAFLGTERVLPEDAEGGAPYLLNPYLTVEGRSALVGWRDGANLGPIVALSGWSGAAAPGGDGVVRFMLIEPTVGIDARHGRFLERGFCPMGHYGVSFVLPVLDPSVSPAKAYPSLALHGAVGAWLGRGRVRPSVELRARVIPRTDGYETTFHENVGVPGWMFFPGTANLWIVLGVAVL
jgi:hypothetical protein